MVAELAPRDRLEELVERPVSAGERDERARERRHHHLPAVHAVHHDELAEPLMRPLEIAQFDRDHPDHLAPGGERGVGAGTHEPHITAPVHHPDPAGREGSAHLARSLQVVRVHRVARSTVDCHPLQVPHALSSTRSARSPHREPLAT